VSADAGVPSPTAAAALSLCRAADAASEAEQRRLLKRGLQLAEEAVAADDADAAGHFGVFCNLGKRMRLDGVRVASLFSLRRLRHEVDRALELDPRNVDALVGKAALLAHEPRVLGGDRDEGEALLRRALDLAPNYSEARLGLAQLLAARGATESAAAEARRVLANEGSPDSGRAREARRLLERLND
jgi:tetratricopeptide (TPR) repeat protein